MNGELIKQLKKLEKHAKKMTGRLTGQEYMHWKSIGAKTKELIVLLKAGGDYDI